MAIKTTLVALCSCAIGILLLGMAIRWQTAEVAAQSSLLDVPITYVELGWAEPTSYVPFEIPLANLDHAAMAVDAEPLNQNGVTLDLRHLSIPAEGTATVTGSVHTNARRGLVIERVVIKGNGRKVATVWIGARVQPLAPALMTEVLRCGRVRPGDAQAVNLTFLARDRAALETVATRVLSLPGRDPDINVEQAGAPIQRASKLGESVFDLPLRLRWSPSHVSSDLEVIEVRIGDARSGLVDVLYDANS